MYPPLKQKLLLTQSTASDATHSAVIDTLGYDRVSIGVAYGTVANTNLDITIKVGEGDTTSAFTDIPALVGGGAGGFTKPTPPTNTSVANTLQFDIDCRTRKRYLLLTVTPFTTKQVTSWATFGSPDQGPSTDGLITRVGI